MLVMTQKSLPQSHSPLSYTLYYDKPCVQEYNRTCHFCYQSQVIFTTLLRYDGVLRSQGKRGTPPHPSLHVSYQHLGTTAIELLEIGAITLWAMVQQPNAHVSGNVCLGLRDLAFALAVLEGTSY